MENKSDLKNGFTTGSCAAAAAKGAAYMLFSGQSAEYMSIETPAGITYTPELLDIVRQEEYVSCAVKKYSGDDPDITNGALICAKVSFIHDGKGDVVIEGGRGVGRVTRPGLDQPVGNAAINSVPREMITSQVKGMMREYEINDSLLVTISVPGGEKLAEKTFNPRLGITGGISIIGSTGIVTPMSTRAVLETIRTELRQRRAEGFESVVISPGNYGLDFMKKRYGYDLDKAVKCSNYIGDTIDMIKELGFKRFLLAGHVGKLIKVSGGIMNTHSKNADCRMELMASALIRAGAGSAPAKEALKCDNTEQVCDLIIDAGLKEKCFEIIMERISFYLNARAGDGLKTECIIYSNKHGLLGCSAGAEEFLSEETKESIT